MNCITNNLRFTRDMKLSDYNISRAKYNELKYFCIQYAEKKQKLQNAYGLKAVVNDGMPKGNLSGDATAHFFYLLAQKR